LQQLLEILCIDVEQTLYRLLACDNIPKEIIILLNAVSQTNDRYVNCF
jgi:hypothetical protein